jgi:hypothetical protein
MGLYNAEISAGSLMLPESRRIARLLLQHPTEAQWDAALKDENLLQKKPATARRQARLIRNRLDTLDDEALQMIVDGDGEIASQLLLVASIRHSRLLADFLREVYGEDLRKLERTLSHRQWDSFMEERGRLDDSIEGWAVSTCEKLFQVIVRILAEAKYLDSTRKMGLTPPLLHPSVINYLKRAGDSATLSCMEFR